MESCIATKRISITEVLPIAPRGVGKFSSSVTVSTRPLIVAVANAESRGINSSGGNSPLKQSSPEGRFLSLVLQNQRNLFQFSVSEQLGELVSNRDGAAPPKKQSSESMQSLLYRRILEVKENERQIAVEDVMYMSIVHKFSEIEVSMITNLSECISDNLRGIWRPNCRELDSVHNLELQDIIRKHVTIILHAMDGVTTAKFDRLHIGRTYASTIMYGYFLKSAYSTWQLNSSPPGKLSSYIKEFISSSEQKCAKLRSKEARNVVEKHTWALFGNEKTGGYDGDSDIVFAFSGLERLMLEAIAFGAFLWDVEKSVDLVYGLRANNYA
ncbi:hypothetical protein ACHQM5_028012 [Ranunculus cassubicifolius]